MVGNNKVELVVSGEATNANANLDNELLSEDVIYTATTNLNDNNIVLKTGTESTTFIIKQFEVSVNWGTTVFNYDMVHPTTPQAPSATIKLADNKTSVTLTVTGGQINANATSAGVVMLGKQNYYATASYNGADASNYVITNNSTSFIIKQIDGTAIINEIDGIYEGDSVTITGFTRYNGVVNPVEGVFGPSDTSSISFGTWNSATKPVEVTVTFTPVNDNYATVTGTLRVSMKAVAYSDKGVYYGTIESALNSVSSGTIYVIPGINPTIKADCTIRGTTTLVLPYNERMYLSREGTSSSFADANLAAVTANRKSNVTIASGITLTIESRATLTIGGILGTTAGGNELQAHTSGSYAQITLAENAMIKSSGTINCYGYIKESTLNNGSKVECSGGTIYMPFVVYDYRGGSSTSGAYDKGKIFPFSVFDMPNIQSLFSISSNASVYGLLDIYTGETSISMLGSSATILARHNTGEALIIGFASDALIKLKSGAIVDVKYNAKFEGNESYTVDDDINGRTTMTFTGGAEFNKMSLKIEAAKDVIYTGAASVLSSTVESLLNTSISSSDCAFPISWKFDIVIDDGTYEISNRIKFMTGSTFIVGENATLNVNAATIAYSSFTDTSPHTPYPAKGSAVFEVNGSIYINADFGAYVTTTSQNALMFISTTTLTVTITEGYGSRDGITMNFHPVEPSIVESLTMDIDGVVGESPTAKVYVSTGTSWTAISKEQVETHTITYYINGQKYKEQTISGLLDNVYLSDGHLASVDVEHYTFDGWYSNSACTGNKVIAGKLSSDINLYAKQTAVVYNLSYEAYYSDENVTANTTFTEKKLSITINDFVNDVFTIPTTASYNNKTFKGWYIGSDRLTSYTQITLSYFESIIIRDEFVADDGTITIKLQCEFVDEYLVTIKDTNNLILSSTINQYVLDGYTLGNYSVTITVSDTIVSYLNDETKPYYYGGFKDSNNNIYTLEQMLALEITENMIFEVIWINKPYTVKYQYSTADNTTTLASFYYNESKTITISNEYDNLSVDGYYNFNNWYINNGTNTYNSGSQYTINSNETIIKANIKKIVLITIKGPGTGWLGAKTYDIDINATSGYYSSDNGKTFKSVSGSTQIAHARGNTDATVYVLEGTTFVQGSNTDVTITVTGAANSSSPYVVGTSNITVKKK